MVERRPMRPDAGFRPESAATRKAATGRHRFAPGRKHVLGGLACLAGGFIILNAVALQTERHPMPLFKSVAPVAQQSFPVPPARPDAPGVRAAAFDSKPAASSRPAVMEKARITPPNTVPVAPAAATSAVALATETSEAMLVEIQRELSKRGYYKGEPDGKPGKATTQAIRDFQFAQRLPVDGKPSDALRKDIASAKATMKDELLELVKRSSQDEPPQRTILDIQRALNKAGYGPLSEDGQMGPTTKTALTRFEQDRKLPARGEPKGQVLRVLASASGVPISQ